jgi:TrmH RNA methyltransferase
MEQVEFRRAEHTAGLLRRLPPSVLTIGTDVRARGRIRDLAAVIRERREEAARGRGGQPLPGIALVMGNEETGLPREVKERCAVLARIPGTGLVESLNVAQAAALFLHELYEL